MNNLFHHLETLKIPPECLYTIRRDFSQLANHFVVYSQINHERANVDSIEHMNNLFPYPDYDDQDHVEGTLNCIHQHGTNALLEMILQIDASLIPNMDEVSDYVTFYVSTDIPFSTINDF